MKSRWIVLAGLAGAALYFGLFGGDYSLFEVRRVERERREEQARLDSVRVEVARLRMRVDSLEGDSLTIERLARERYGLIRDGERLYRYVDSAGR